MFGGLCSILSSGECVGLDQGSGDSTLVKGSGLLIRKLVVQAPIPIHCHLRKALIIDDPAL